MKTRNLKNPTATGFTLIEVMITVVVIAILAAVALPSYFDYVTRSRFVEAKTSLVDMRTRLEQYFLDNRSYPGSCIAPASGPAPAGKIYLPLDASSDAKNKFFKIACDNLSATTYTVTATGTGSMDGFVFTIDQANVRKTTGAKSGWTTSDTCWISRKNGDC
jgi:type IV pilus assembly protein PilE